MPVNMFPHTVTIYHKEDEQYKRQIVHGVYWYGPTTVSQNGKGLDKGESITVVIPRGPASTVTVAPDDLMVLGESPEITSVIELENVPSATITSIDRNSVERVLDNMVLSGV